MNNDFIPGIFAKVDDFEKHNIHGIVYIVLNTLNNKYYVGQTKNSLRDRKMQHLRSKGHTKFRYALQKHKDYFVWTIQDVAKSKAELDEKEKYWIRHLKSNDENFGYNLTSGGDGRCDFKHKKESNEKRSLSNRKHYTDLFYKENDVKAILYYMKNNECTFNDCALHFGLKDNKLKNFFKKEFPELYNFYLPRSEKIRHQRTRKGLLDREYIPKRIHIDINSILILLDICNSFIEIADKLNVKSGIIKNRLQEYDKDLYDSTVKRYVRYRNININNKRYGTNN